MDPLTGYPFGTAAHDRLVDRRDDQDFLDQAWSDPASRVLVIRGDSLATDESGRSLCRLPPADAPAGERMLLGSVDGAVHFLIVRREDDLGDAGQEKIRFEGLRQLASALDATQSSLAVHAVALAGWHARHPRCAVCGAHTQVALAGAIRRCPDCSTTHFPRTDPAVIMLVTDDQDRCLLGHNSARSAPWFSTLAGFVEPGETLEQAVAREVFEEAGVIVSDVTYAGSQPWPFPSSLMLGFFARAATTEITVDGEEITEARWFTREDVAREVLAGELFLPTTLSISGALLTRWYGEKLPTPPARVKKPAWP
ncbi:MAG: NAD(+) diphosphatase [Nocardioidaceae bacterium]|nr:NAD(+) diphosphatase [Nocardioidaceae bacterium]